MKYHIAALTLTSFLCSGIANATLVSFFDEASFLASAGMTTMESFENIPVTDGATLLPSISATDLDNHFDVTGFSSSFQIWDLSDPSAPNATDGTQALFWLAQNPTPFPNSDPKSFTLSNFNGASASITALGMYIMDWASAPDVSGTLTFSNDNGESAIVATAPPGLPDWNTFFYGVISDTPFTSGTFTTTTDDGWHLIDEVYYATHTSVPEPNILWLLLGGAIGFLGHRTLRIRT